MKEFEKDFYAHLGLLSVQFSKMEYNLSVILGKLLRSDEDLIAATILENNNLHKNLDLLKKINRIRGYQEPHIKNLLDQINKVRKDRNLFVHGVWSTPYESENEILIKCEERRIRYSEPIEKQSAVRCKRWSRIQKYTFRLSYIQKKISSIDDIIVAQEFFIKKLESEAFI